MCSILTSRWSSKSEGEEWKKNNTQHWVMWGNTLNIPKTRWVSGEARPMPMSMWGAPFSSFLLYPTNSSTPNSSRNDYNHIRRLCRRSFASKKWNYTILYFFSISSHRSARKVPREHASAFFLLLIDDVRVCSCWILFLVALALSLRCCQSFSFCSRAALAWSIKIYVSTWMARDEKLDLYVYGWAARD